MAFPTFYHCANMDAFAWKGMQDNLGIGVGWQLAFATAVLMFCVLASCVLRFCRLSSFGLLLSYLNPRVTRISPSPSVVSPFSQMYHFPLFAIFPTSPLPCIPSLFLVWIHAFSISHPSGLARLQTLPPLATHILNGHLVTLTRISDQKTAFSSIIFRAYQYRIWSSSPTNMGY